MGLSFFSKHLPIQEGQPWALKTPADIISTVEFNHTGELLATE
ncbi:PPP2R2C isoform 8 [Pan troglodytes]|uniref:Protein phosphatase 2 regulatory subunit Bgamma n=3 Tax=Hominidae TaxID=9604 RepID=D6R943_HUMAN|nr:PPP2R2C isoform 8 [Pan troglodytes]PNJ13225.1 PPP2R2C isoform 8 [Pongo abelii]